jgi:hypothetical protein
MPGTSRLCRISMALLLAALAVLLACPAASAEPRRQGNRYALLVGVKSYDHSKLPDLRCTENDVEDLAGLLQGKESGFSRVVLLTTARGERVAAARPTARNIRAALKGLLARVTKHDLVLVALSGHGMQLKVKERDESFFCPCDARPSDPGTLIGLKDLFAQLDDSGAGVKLLLVDACRNDPAAGRNVDIDALPAAPRGVAALFSCSSGQRAFETDKLGGRGHGVFFHFVLEGLKGRASNEESEVTWDGLSAYVKRQVPEAVARVIGGGARQSPHLIANLSGVPPVLRRVAPGSVGSRPAQPPRPAPALFAGDWKGSWYNSVGESGDDESLTLTEDGKGNLSGTWWGTIRVTGRRRGQASFEMSGSTDRRSYRATGVLADGVLVINYTATRLDAEGSYTGVSRLRRVK